MFEPTSLRTSLRNVLVGLLPPAARRYARSLQRETVFRRAFRSFARTPRASLAAPGPVWADLVYGWGNEGGAGREEYLRACVAYTLSTSGPMLECGTGLTTLVAGAAAQRCGRTLWSLEHDPQWSARVRRTLGQLGITSVRVCTDRLHDYGEFDWYAPPLASMPLAFGLVICDGPPASTRGARYGLLPVMTSRLNPGCVILLDDAAREEEQAVARRWSEQWPFRCELHGVAKPYFVMTRRARAVRADAAAPIDRHPAVDRDGEA